MKTPFDDLFDFNRDGSLDWLEEGARDAFIFTMLEDDEEESESDSDDDDDEW